MSNEKKEVNFCDGTWKVGDKVFHRIWGWASIELITENSLKVSGQWFSYLGRSMFLDKYPVILPNEYEIPDEAYERPTSLPVDTPVWVRNKTTWLRRHVAEWRGDVVLCWTGGHTSFTGDGRTQVWKEWRLHDPPKEAIDK